MIRTAPAWPLAAAAVLAGLATSAVRAQAPATTLPGDEVVALPAFNVTGDAAHGYVASESTTGTRVAAKIQDLPFDVEVVTSDFMNDFGEFDLNSQLSSVSGFSPSEVAGQYQLRGFASPVTLVDGFRRIGLVDRSDMQRIEVIKGTAGSIYGAVPPGGVVAIETKQPTATPTQELGLYAGSDGFYRAELDSSGPIGNGHFFYRIDGSENTQKYAEEFASRHNSYISGKLQWKPDDDTNLEVSFMHHELYEHPFVQALTVTEKGVMPWAGNSITESQYYGMATNLLDYNYAGPESYDHQRVNSATLTFEHRVSDVYSLRFGANAFTNPYNDQAVGSGAYYPYGTGNVTVVNGVVQQPFTPEVKDQPQVDWRPQRGGGMQLDNLFKFATGPVKNQVLVTGDYYELSQRQVSYAAVSGTGQATDYYALYSPYNAAGSSYYTPASTWTPATNGYGWNTTLYGANPSLYSDITQDQWQAFSDYGIFGSEQASMFDDHLILMAGLRWDYVKNQVKNYNIPGPGGTSYVVGGPEPTPYQAFDYNVQGYSYQLGASFKVVDGVNIYASKSTGFNPQPQISTNTGLALPNNTSTGYEFGVKTLLMGGRLGVTVDHFQINEYNLAQSETDPVTGVRDTILAGEEQSKGYELALNYSVTNDLNVRAAWGYTQARVIDADPLTFLNDLPIRRVPRNNVSFTPSYHFSQGFLRGAFVNFTANYFSKSLVNLGSGKSLIPGPGSATVGSTGSMYYVAATNTTYTLADPKITGEQKITATPVVNVPFPGNGALPYPSQPANALINYPMSPTGQPLPLANASVPGVYSGMPEGVFVDDGRQNNFNAPYAVFNAGVGYSWKTGAVKNKLQLNVYNLADRKYTYGSGAPGIPFGMVGSYTVSF